MVQGVAKTRMSVGLTVGISEFRGCSFRFLRGLLFFRFSSQM